VQLSGAEGGAGRGEEGWDQKLSGNFAPDAFKEDHERIVSDYFAN